MRTLAFLAGAAAVLGAASKTQEKPTVGIGAYHLEVKAYPETHRLVITATEPLTGQAIEPVTLAFSLHQDFKVKHVTQGERTLPFTQAGSTIRVSGVRTGSNAPPLHWEYEGTFDPPPYKFDSMRAIIVAADEVRVSYTAPWFPELKNPGETNRPASSLAIEVPEGFVTACGDDEAQPPKTAAGRTRYEFASSGHGSLSFCAARYQVKRLTQGGRQLRAYYFPKNAGEPQNELQISKQRPQNEKNVEQALQTSSDIIDFFSQTLCPYPSGGFSLVQKSAYKGFAYGVSAYVVLNGFESCDERFLAHEIAHQWWGNLIHPVGEAERWLTESFAEYSAFLYLQKMRGEMQVEKDQDFLIREAVNCTPIRKTSFNTRDYENVIYKIGPYVFHALRYVVGDEEFFAILKTFAQEYAHRNATVADFIRLSERVHKESLAWFFADWLDHTKSPQFILESTVTSNGTAGVTIKGKVIQNRTQYRLPLRLEIVGTGALAAPAQTLWVAGKETPFEYTVAGHPQGIRFAKAMSTWILGEFFDNAADASKPPVVNKPQPDSGFAEFIQSLKKQVKVTLPYLPGEAITLTLAAREATLLTCNENTFGLREILICPQEGLLYHYAFWNGGEVHGGGRSLEEGHAFKPNQSDLGFLEDWEIKDNRVVLRYQAVTNAQEVQRLSAKPRAQR